MSPKSLLLFISCLVLLFGDLLPLISMTTTTTLVAAMSIANQDLERYFRAINVTHAHSMVTEERIAVDVFHYAFLNWSYSEGMDLVESNYRDEQARYGEGRVLTVTGKLVHVTNTEDLSDDYACTPHLAGTGGQPMPNKNVSWIALVRRGRCTFEDKVKHVFAHHARGIIIYNDRQVFQLEKMQIKGKTRNITAVITYQKIGLELAHIVDRGYDLHIGIIEGRTGIRPLSPAHRTSVLFISLSFIIVLMLSLIWMIYYYIHRFRDLQAKDRESRNLCSVTKKAIMKIPTKTGKISDEKDLDSDCCAICIEAYKPTDIIRILPCKHEFHKNCIDPWLIEHRTCPMCKLDVLKFYGYVVGDQLQPNGVFNTLTTTPSPQHIINGVVDIQAPPPAHLLHDNHDVSVIVVAVTSPLQVSMQQQQPQQRRNSAPASVVLQTPSSSHNDIGMPDALHVSTASRQVTDV